jgi:uncharacterized membrane protein
MHENARLEFFSDAVFAIALTLLVIDLKVPAAAHHATSAELWRALRDLLPSFFAFVLSFGTIFITWVNHHEAMRLVVRSSPRFMYANGFMLLTIVIVPFPTALLGENVLGDHAAPAVVLYSATYTLQALGWWLVTSAALGPRPLVRDDGAAARMVKMRADARRAAAFYTACAITAAWLPLAIAILITVTWCVWLAASLTMRSSDPARDLRAAPAAPASSRPPCA